MKILGTQHASRAPWTHRVFGLFVVVWFSVALQPCAMAMGGDDEHDCPHCPPAHAAHHDEHEMAAADKAHSDAPCATGVADCGVSDAFDIRNPQLKLEDLPNEVPVTVSSMEALTPVVPFIAIRGAGPTRSPPPAQSSSLNVLYCVYLD